MLQKLLILIVVFSVNTVATSTAHAYSIKNMFESELNLTIGQTHSTQSFSQINAVKEVYPHLFANASGVLNRFNSNSSEDQRSSFDRTLGRANLNQGNMSLSHLNINPTYKPHLKMSRGARITLRVAGTLIFVSIVVIVFGPALLSVASQ